MKALEMRMAWALKAHSHYRLCIKCGHMNNGETERHLKICLCAVPVLIDHKVFRSRYAGVPLNELRHLDEFRRHFGGEERTIVDEDEVDRWSRYRKLEHSHNKS